MRISDTKSHRFTKYDALTTQGIMLLICVPTRDGKCSLDFAVSLAKTGELLNKYKIPYLVQKSDNSCFVDLSRNLFEAQFMKSKATHLLQIDDDMGWNAEAVLDMLCFNKEFISGIGRKKTEKEDYAGINYTDENGIPIGKAGSEQEDFLIEMEYIGGAFTLTKKSVFEKLRKAHPELKGKLPRHEYAYHFYHTQYSKNGWFSEDYVFCHLCRSAGIKIWCYPNIDMNHLGLKDYKGNYFKFLKGLKDEA